MRDMIFWEEMCMKKKLTGILLSLVLLLCLLPLGGTSVATAAVSQCPGSGTASDPWIISVAGAQTKMQAVYTASNHTLTISISGGSNSSMIDFGIMTGNGITNYYYPWSDVRTEIEKVVIGSGVNNISRYAFYGCTGLKEVVIADSVERISEHAFNGCQSLTSVQMPAKLKRISVGAFTNCTSLTSVTLPEGLEDIWTRAFYNCTSLASVNIPSTTKDISEGAFYGTKLSGTITIPASVTTLEGGAFANCKSISAFSVASSNTKYCSVDGVIFTKDQKTLVHAPGKLRSGYTLPSTLPVETIGEFAFRGCNIPTVTLSSTVKTIGEGAFQDCTRLKTVMLENSVTTIGANAFAGCTGLNALPDQSGVTGYVKYNGTRQQRDARLTIDNTGNGNTPLLDALWLYNACDPADHEHSGWASNETEHYHVCKLCRARYDQTAHTYAVVSGVATCKVCNYANASYGDVDGNGSVNNTDLTALLRHVAKIELLSDTSRADINKDGNIDAADVTSLAKMLNP